MPEKAKRHFMKEKESKELLNTASQLLGVDVRKLLDAKANIEVVESQGMQVILAEGKPVLVKDDARTYPALTFTELLNTLPKAVVDMGAVPHVCKGANIMAPGVRHYEGEFQKGNYVLVVDEKYGKPLALGQAVHSVEEARNTKQGAVVTNVHFVGDKAWNLMKKLAEANR